MSRINLDYGRPVFGESIACHDLMFLSVMSCFVLKSRELQLTLLPATNVIATFGKKIWCRNDREEQLPKNITRRRDIYCASTSIYRPITRMESFFSEMAILWGLLRYTTKDQKFWPYGLLKILKSSMAQNA